LKSLERRNPMRVVLHAKLGDHIAKLPCASDRVSRSSPSPPLHDSSVEAFEAALTKARAAWRASRGPTRTATHHWSRQLKALGHTVRLMPPVYVKPTSSGKGTMPLTPRPFVKL
jgi:hypothetical protein